MLVRRGLSVSRNALNSLIYYSIIQSTSSDRHNEPADADTATEAKKNVPQVL